MEPAAIDQQRFPEPPRPTPMGPPALRIFATFLSYLFHPVFMPVLIILVIWRIQPAEFAGIDKKKLVYGLISLVSITVFFPLLVVVLAKALGFVQSIHMRVSRDRIIPLVATMIFYFWAQQVSGLPFKNDAGENMNVYWPLIVRIMMLGTFWGIVVLFMASIFFKVSMHTTAAGGAIGIMIVLLFLSSFNVLTALLVTILIGGLVGTARLVLREHTPFELWVGYAIGIIVQLAAWAYVR